MASFQSIISEIKKRVPFVQEEFDLFAEKLSLQTLDTNEVWEQPGKVSQQMAFVNRGMLRQFSLKEDKEFTDFFFTENEFIGNYISYLQKVPSVSCIQALEPCELWVISFADLEKLYEVLPVVEEFSRIIGNEKLFQMEARNKSLLMASPEERYRKLLQERPGLVQRVPQYMIAQYLGIRPETLSRIRRRKLS